MRFLLGIKWLWAWIIECYAKKQNKTKNGDVTHQWRRATVQHLPDKIDLIIWLNITQLLNVRSMYIKHGMH